MKSAPIFAATSRARSGFFSAMPIQSTFPCRAATSPRNSPTRPAPTTARPMLFGFCRIPGLECAAQNRDREEAIRPRALPHPLRGYHGGLRYHGTHMKVRWRICLLLFLTWVMSYVDRSLMPMALPLISQEFHLSPTVMGVVISAFFVGYASMQIPGGILADKFGPRKTM